ncbi:double-strand-break repair protein rad21-like protein 1 [Pelobates fuscus]|uniref:double-strand-break repair protein rad21-like protein 1 n=1 Tax=Pelobates fuscus TaxID=191477 RepID=UPI002FE4F89F
MFYTQLLLNKRGPLSKIWIAAHWDKKLTKAHIFECNLESAIENIISPKITIALRTSGHLLLGVVRIYHRKAKYLLSDCSEAFVKMKMAFRPGAVDLAEDNQEATYNSITLPEEFHEFDLQLPDINVINVVDHFTRNQSRAEDITLREDYGREIMLHDTFGEEVEELRHDRLFEGSFEVSTNSFQPESSSMSLHREDRNPYTQDCFGDEGLMAGFFDDKPMTAEAGDLNENIQEMNSDVLFQPELPLPSTEEKPESAEMALEISLPAEPKENQPAVNHTTLVNEQDGFILEPVDITAVLERKKSKRKRILIVDQLKELASNAMRQQLLDFSDTLTTVDIAPPTRKLMDWKVNGGVDWLLSHPCQPIISSNLQMIFTHFDKKIEKKHSKIIQEERAESETETMRPEQDVIDLPQLEEPSHLQESRLTDISSSATDEVLQIIRETELNPEMDNESFVAPWNVSQGHIPQCPTEEHLEDVDKAQDNEERRWNKRTQEMLTRLRNLNQTGLTSFSLLKLCKNNYRKEASTKFYSFLVLKKQSALELRQSGPYSDIIATPGSSFYSL